MSDTNISDTVVEAAISAYRSAFEWTDRLDRDAMRAALAAALHYLHPQPAELSFDVEAMLTACVPGGSIVDPQVVADNIRAWFADRKPAELAEQQVGEESAGLPEMCRSSTNAQVMQVGDVQGDGLVTLAENWRTCADKHELSALEADSIGGMPATVRVHETKSEVFRQVAAELGEALAARQPGAQVPFAWGLIHGGERSVSLDRHKCDDGTEFDDTFQFPLYTAPPAKGIDLGQLWEQAHAAMLDQRKRNKHDCFVFRCLKDDVQKLIDDQRDSAPGVE